MLEMTSVSPFLPIIITLFLLPIFSSSQTNVSIGSTLIAGDENQPPWISPSGEFAFGFWQLDNANQFLVAVWYNNISEKTLAWYANGDNPAQKGSNLNLTSNRGLLLVSPNGEETQISDPIVRTVTHGSMLNTGNFVLFNGDSESLWESFNNVKDTILPGQAFKEGFSLSSRLSETNYSRGRFLLSLLGNGNLELATVNLPGEYKNEAYYLNGTIDGSGSSDYQLIFNESAWIFTLANNKIATIFSEGEKGPSRTFYHYARLDFDGIFTHYRRSKAFNDDKGWSVVWSIPDNICLANLVTKGSGVCGYNKICSLVNGNRPYCSCPSPFYQVNPEDDYRGCTPTFVQNCIDDPNDAESLYDFRTVTNIDWPMTDYEVLKPFNEDECKDSCLHDCMCAVAVFNGDTCWKKKLPLSNGRVGSSVNRRVFIKQRRGDSPAESSKSSEPNKNKNTIIVIISVFLGSSVLINFILLSVMCLGFFLVYRNRITQFNRGGSSMDQNLRYFSYKELVNATDLFKEELGRGAFGIVYKGVINSGRSPIFVAVKRLDRVIQDGDKDFKTEVNVIGQTHHKNLVRLIGFCEEGSNRLLVYEFLKNGTLANFIFGDLKLTWNQRTQIAVGIARGLLYLHDECSTQIIHCDIKPQNILLDDSYVPRISDFGLAKLLRMDQSETQTAIRGTKGYVAPEWFRNMAITVKADVYSFGVLLLEIVCCRKNAALELGGEQAFLSFWAYDCYREGTTQKLVGNDSDAAFDKKRLERFIMVALWCIQEDPHLRPTMKKVVLMLEEVVEVPGPPCPTPYSTGSSMLDST
nr:G-type lectin S-receptor-like serine/threonine-protein kinase LECRK2 [Ipomoea batatas]